MTTLIGADASALPTKFTSTLIGFLVKHILVVFLHNSPPENFLAAKMTAGRKLFIE
jgi:hypothetical protein